MSFFPIKIGRLSIKISFFFLIPFNFKLLPWSDRRPHQLSGDNKPWEDLFAEIRSNLAQQAQVNEDISGPFTYFVINRAGVAM